MKESWSILIISSPWDPGCVTNLEYVNSRCSLQLLTRHQRAARILRIYSLQDTTHTLCGIGLPVALLPVAVLGEYFEYRKRLKVHVFVDVEVGADAARYAKPRIHG
ncbi:uncharacterized protein ARMOST_10016 [Armillaria ostoyae]|uniref:Uncharacterized protein n=1 Tax=Armillaria ostoyae TaxID=47428 RepID=A0A284RD44_ARMOS|nr:uncharacterized protein ARMOST_10016 [Armillaria ostoyae]